MRAVALVVLALTLSAAAYLPGTAPAAASGAASGAAGATEDSARPTRPAGPVRIMLGGDSITHQFSGDYTWRWRLWREFRRQGVPVDFVGVRSYPAPDYNGNVNPPLVPFPEDRHSSHAGAQLVHQVGVIAHQVRTLHPDVVMTMIGHNDLFRGRTPMQLLALAQEYVESIWAVDPTVTIALGEVMNAIRYRSGESTFDGINLSYNRLLRTMIHDYRSRGRSIFLIDTQTPTREPREMSHDGSHPNPPGETYLAQKYAAALVRIGVLPDRPHLFRPNARWDPRPVPDVRHSGRRIMFSWPAAYDRLRLTSGRVRVFNARGERVRLLRSGWAGHQVSTTLPRGRYTATLQPVRRWMTGRQGPPRRFVVTAPRAWHGPEDAPRQRGLDVGHASE